MITVLTDPAVGGTFLTWSIHYLSGHNQYFLQEKQAWQDVTSNPLTNSGNAHNFIPNQPNRLFNCTAEQFKQFVKELANTKTDTFHTLYFHEFSTSDTTKESLDYVNSQASKLVIVDSSNTPLYHCSYKKRGHLRIDNQTLITDDKAIQNYLISKYFNQSKKVWDDINLHDTWDLREFLALNFRPFESKHIYPCVNKSVDCFVIKGLDLWTSFDSTVENLFNYLQLNIDQQRFNNWQQIYTQWKKLQYQRLMFSVYFDSIIDSILNNYTLDLTRFNLDIEQEAAIQHYLIYKHNLNFKTWQLEKFVDTKQLHSLLEPNLHPLN